MPSASAWMSSSRPCLSTGRAGPYCARSSPSTCAPDRMGEREREERVRVVVDGPGRRDVRKVAKIVFESRGCSLARTFSRWIRSLVLWMSTSSLTNCDTGMSTVVSYRNWCSSDLPLQWMTTILARRVGWTLARRS